LTKQISYQRQGDAAHFCAFTEISDIFAARRWQRGSRDSIFVVSRSPLMTFNVIERIGEALSALFYFPPHR
jgi:hypothetical protein